MRKEAAQAFMRMVDAAILDNIIIKNSSAYRSYDYQVKLYDNYVKEMVRMRQIFIRQEQDFLNIKQDCVRT